MLPLTLVCLALLSGASASTLTSSGTKGNVCTNDDTYICPPEETTCGASGHCECSAGFGGAPGLQCLLSENDRLCTWTNDPIAQTFNGQKARSDVPCNVLMTEGEKVTPVSTCRFKVFAHNTRHKGKVFPHGFEVQAELTAVGQTFKKGYRVSGSAFQGVHTHNLELSYDPTASPRTFNDVFTQNDAKLWFYSTIFDLDVDTNRVNLNLLSACGLIIKFRAVDTSLSVFKQTGLPGLSILLNQDVTIEGAHQTICMDTNAQISQYLPYNRGITSEFARRSYGNDVPQDFPNASPECAATDVFDSCADDEALSDALNDCAEIYNEPPFINCYSGSSDPSSTRILQLFKACINMICTATSCPADIKNVVSGLDANCKGKIPGPLASCKMQ